MAPTIRSAYRLLAAISTMALAPFALVACGDSTATTIDTETAGTTESTTETGDTDAPIQPCAAGLEEGALVISEVMANPTGADDAREWIELYNPGAAAVSLEGVRLVISKANGESEDVHVIPAGVEIAAGDYLTAGNVFNAADLDYIDHSYGDDLGDMINSAGLVRVMCGTTELDAVVYESEKDGSSFNFNGAIVPDAAANDNADEWCRATGASADFQTGDLGTPGEPNPFCPPPAGECYDGTDRRPLATPGPGDIVITEFMADPEGTDQGQEWFELHVVAPAVDLNGLVFGKTPGEPEAMFYDPEDGVFECVSVEANTTLLLAQSDNPDANGGLTRPDLLFKDSISLRNSDGSLWIGHGETVIDLINYTDSESGLATSLAPDFLSADANDEADPPTDGSEGAWCFAAVPYGPGGAGTPGQLNPECGQCLDANTREPRDPVHPEPGDLVITEFMPNPEGSDPDREWFEVYVTKDVDLIEVTIKKDEDDEGEPVPNDAGTCLGVSAGSYLLFAKSRDANANDGLPAPSFLVDMSLSNSGVQGLMLARRSTIIDALTYDGSTEGASYSLGVDPPDASHDDATAAPWCLASEIYGTGGINAGSPGVANPVCGG